MKPITFAVPKGRILEELIPLLTRADIVPEDDFFSESSRKLVFSTNRKNLNLVKVRSFDVATFVKFGAADIGICGLDVLEEFSSSEIFPVLDLGIGKCRLSIAAIKSAELDLAKRSHIRIATKYTAIASKYFSELGIQSEAIKLNGSIEIAPKLNLCDFILDLVSSGKTLAENNMVEIKSILEVTSYLTVNRTSFKTSNSELSQLIKLFDVA
jgi:ATP phosphoribosyltransferase